MIFALSLPPEKRMAESCLLYYITDRTAFPGDELARRRRLLEKISEAARAGVDYIQLREKDLPARELEALARQAAALIAQRRTESRETRTRLLINSRTDVALAVGADGVQLRSEDVSPQEVRSIWKECGAGVPTRAAPRKDPLVAVSCHTPVCEKKDAPGARPAGLALLKQACQEKIPVLALGGITIANARSCLEAGAAGIAAIRLFQENDVAEVVRRLRAL